MLPKVIAGGNTIPHVMQWLCNGLVVPGFQTRGMGDKIFPSKILVIYIFVRNTEF